MAISNVMTPVWYDQEEYGRFKHIFVGEAYDSGQNPDWQETPGNSVWEPYFNLSVRGNLSDRCRVFRIRMDNYNTLGALKSLSVSVGVAFIKNVSNPVPNNYSDTITLHAALLDGGVWKKVLLNAVKSHAMGTAKDTHVVSNCYTQWNNIPSDIHQLTKFTFNFDNLSRNAYYYNTDTCYLAIWVDDAWYNARKQDSSLPRPEILLRFFTNLSSGTYKTYSQVSAYGQPCGYRLENSVYQYGYIPSDYGITSKTFYNLGLLAYQQSINAGELLQYEIQRTIRENITIKYMDGSKTLKSYVNASGRYISYGSDTVPLSWLTDSSGSIQRSKTITIVATEPNGRSAQTTFTLLGPPFGVGCNSSVVCGNNITLNFSNRNNNTVTLKFTRNGETNAVYQTNVNADSTQIVCQESWFTGANNTNVDSIRINITATCSDGAVAQASFELLKLPGITSQPVNVKTGDGLQATFSVGANYNPTYFQWQVSTNNGGAWSNLSSGSTGNTLQLTVNTSMNNYLYRCVIGNRAGTVYSNSAKLTVLAKPKVTAQPHNISVVASSTATISVIATGDELSYQWQTRSGNNSDWVNYAGTGANTREISIANAAASLDGTQYRCVITNPYASATSDAATLTVITPPVITQHPRNILVDHGLQASFTSNASGHDIYYQWQQRENSAGAWNNVGENVIDGKTYTFTANVSYDGYQYRCVISNAAGTVYTNVATLNVVVNTAIITEWLCWDESEPFTFQSDGHSPLRIVIYTQDGTDVAGCEVKPMLEEGTSSRIWISPVQGDHDISNDFNYGWLSIGNLYDDRENAVMSSMPCEIKLRYRPIWKDTL